MVQQNSLVCLLELLGSELFFDEIDLLHPQMGKVIESRILHVVIHLILTTIENHNTGISPIESTEGPSTCVIEVVTQPDRVCITDLVIATDEKCGDTLAPYRLGEELDVAGRLIAVFGVIDAVPVEHHEVVINILDLLEKGFEDVVPLVKVVENHRCK